MIRPMRPKSNPSATPSPADLPLLFASFIVPRMSASQITRRTMTTIATPAKDEDEPYCAVIM
jgi:hypothetical protein